MAPAMFGRSDNSSNVSLDALVSTSLLALASLGNLMKSFLKSYSALTTSVNASRAVALPTFIAMPAFSNDPPCVKSDIVRLPRLFLVGCSSTTACLPFVAYDEE